MVRTLALFAALAVSLTASAATPPQAAAQRAAVTLTAAEIVAKNVEARGGLEAWRRIQTLAWAGHVEGGAPVPMPFVMEMQRPNKTRFEITSIDRRFVRIFDGRNGWRVRPGANGAPDTRAFSREEDDYARNEFVIDGPLIDYEVKGVTIKLLGLDEIEGRKAHLLEVTLPVGASRRIWVDAETFLDVRVDRPSTNPLAKGAPSSIYYSNWRSIEGVTIPLIIESRSATAPLAAEKLIIEKVAFNPRLPELVFAKPPSAWQKSATVRIGDAPVNAGVSRPAH
jgi:hypothetical protein